MSGFSVDGLVARQGSFTLGPVDIDVPGGAAAAVIGPSGAGKTTLLRSIAGFVPTDAGAVRIEGVDRTRSPPERRLAGYVPQGLGLFPHRTVGGNLRYPREVRGLPDVVEKSREVAAAWGLSELLRRRPAELSGGEQQRVAIARALNSDPRVLLWDEPLSAVDAVARAVLIELSRRVIEENRIPLVLVTHDAETAFSVADRFLVLEEGRAVFFGPSETLFRTPPNRFAARFVGYDNVLAPEEIARLGDRDLEQFLTERAGPEGVCFPADGVRAAGTGPRWEGRVVRSRVLPSALRVGLSVGSVEMSVLLPRPAVGAASVRAGEIFPFEIPETAIRPVGQAERGAT